MNKMRFTLAFVLIFIVFQFKAKAQVFSFNFDGITRSYRVYLPSTYHPLNSYSMIINLHGYTSTAAAQEAYTSFNVIADTANVVMVYPDGVSNAWNSGWSNPYYSGVKDVEFISALIDTMIQNYSINQCRVYAIGMSNGGFMSHRLACELEDKIAAIAGVTGMLADSVAYYCQTNRAVPIMQIQGNADAVVNFNGSPFAYRSFDNMINWWYNHNHCLNTEAVYNFPNSSLTDNCTAELTIHNQCDGNSAIYAIKIINGGHTWPGASVDIPSNGNTNRDISGSNEIWKFLRKFDCNSGTVGVEESKKESQFVVFPNPASTEVKFSKNIDYLRVYNSLGILQKEYYSTTSIDVTSYKKGMYFFEITSHLLKEYKVVIIN